jgi:hypothetical protein
MYGENEVNDFHLLKYNLYLDFFEYFSIVKICGLPLAQCLIMEFDRKIQPFIDQNLNNKVHILKMQYLNRFKSMGEINQKLLSFDNIPSVIISKNEKSILLTEDYFDFAVDQLKEYNVTVLEYKNEYDRALPNHFNKINFNNELINANVLQEVKQQALLIKSYVQKRLKAVGNHYYFNTANFQKWIIKVSLNIVRWVYILEQIILTTRPTVMILPSEASIFGTILGLLSKKYQIPFVLMPVSIIGDRTILPSRADYYFLWGKNQTNWFLERMYKKEQLFEIGNVRFFYEMKGLNQSKKIFNRAFNIPDNHRIIGFTSQPFPDANSQIEKWIEAIPKDLPVTIVIRKHVGDQYEYLLLSNNTNVRIIPRDYRLYDFLNAIDVLMTISSNTAIEATILEKPLLILQPNITYHYRLNNNQLNSHLAKAQAGEIINNEEALIEAIKKVVREPNYLKDLKSIGTQFLSNTLITVDHAPRLAKDKIKEIITSHTNTGDEFESV